MVRPRNHLRVVRALPSIPAPRQHWQAGGTLDEMEGIVGYREWLHAIPLKGTTIRNYLSMLARIVDWCDEHGTHIDRLLPSQVAEIADTLPLSHASRRHLRTTLRYWYQYRDILTRASEAVTVPPKPKMRWRGIEDEDAAALVRTAVGWHPEGTAVLAMLSMGIRRAEVAGLRRDWIHPRQRTWTVIGKGDKERTLPVHSLLWGQLVRLDLVDDRSGIPWVFPGRTGGHVVPATVSLWMTRVVDAAGLDHVSPHQLRHTAVAMINDTMGIRIAQAFAGHEDIGTTQGYTRVTDDQLTEALGALTYLGKPLRVVS